MKTLLVIGLAAIGAAQGATPTERCSTINGFEAWEDRCKEPMCDIVWPLFCKLNEGHKHIGPCAPKKDFPEHSLFCIMENCDVLYSDWCDKLDPSEIEGSESRRSVAAVRAHSSEDRCTVREGAEAWEVRCKEPDCEIVWSAFCKLNDGHGYEGRCKPREGWLEFGMFCKDENCDTLYADWCELNDGSSPTDAPIKPPTSPVDPPTSPVDPPPAAPPTSPVDQPPAQPEVDCAAVAAAHKIPAEMLSHDCAVSLAKRVCAETPCPNATCLSNRMKQFYLSLGIEV